jgi:predicted TPR repeat methyltransferase
MSPAPIPTDAFTQRLQRIRQQIAAGQLREAADALTKAQKQHPEDARIALLGMRLAAQAGNPAGALQAARRALQLAPDWDVALIELGLLLAEQGPRDEAMKLARRALELQPVDINVRLGAVQIAARAGHADQATEWAQQGVHDHPEHLELRLFLGRALVARRDYGQALPHFEFVRARQPSNVDALLGVMSCERVIGDPERFKAQAGEALALRPGDASVRFWHDIAHGRTPPTMPAPLVAALYDEYAPYYDMHMVRGLKYRVPERIAELLKRAWPDQRFNLLDLGCGTGLVGLYLGRIQGHIIGVDLSRRMLAEAARHNLYSRFHRVNMLDALTNTPADHYEAITCADALAEVGDAAPVIPNALRILKPGGLFIFSCESAGEDEADLALRPASMRYAHKPSAIRRLCEAAGFTGIEIEELPALRIEDGQPVPGFLVQARKPG